MGLVPHSRGLPATCIPVCTWSSAQPGRVARATGHAVLVACCSRSFLMLFYLFFYACVARDGGGTWMRQAGTRTITTRPTVIRGQMLRPCSDTDMKPNEHHRLLHLQHHHTQPLSPSETDTPHSQLTTSPPSPPHRSGTTTWTCPVPPPPGHPWSKRVAGG